MVSKWPVVVEVVLGAGDCDATGRLTNAAVERHFAQARLAYFERCRTVDAAGLTVSELTIDEDEPAVGATSVTVATNVVEVYPESFTMTAKLRADTGDPVASAQCSLSSGGEVTKAMRDEFITLAHAAEHYA